MLLPPIAFPGLEPLAVPALPVPVPSWALTCPPALPSDLGSGYPNSPSPQSHCHPKATITLVTPLSQTLEMLFWRGM